MLLSHIFLAISSLFSSDDNISLQGVLLYIRSNQLLPILNNQGKLTSFAFRLIPWSVVVSARL